MIPARAGAASWRRRPSPRVAIVRRVTTTTADRRNAGAWVAVLSLLWFVTVPPLVLFGFFASLSFTVEPNPDAGRGAVCFVAAGILTVLLPLAAALVAYRGRRPALGGVYLVLTLLLSVPGVALAGTGADTLGGPDPAPPPAPRTPGGCQEHSGGDTRCPGG